MPFDDYRFMVEYITLDGDVITRYFCCEDVARKVAEAHGVEVVALAVNPHSHTAAPVYAAYGEKLSNDVDRPPASRHPAHE